MKALLSDRRLGALKHLSLQGTRCWDDDKLIAILPYLPKLELLNLSETSITGVGVKAMVNTGHIKKIIVRDCQSLSKDAVHWARGKGVSIDDKDRKR
jgi:F-box/TPR repeat protein Pof3